MTKIEKSEYNTYSQKTDDVLMADTQKKTPEEEPFFGGPFLCLLALAVSVKPLADVVADYTCCDRQEKTDDVIHADTSFPLPDWRRAALIL